MRCENKTFLQNDPGFLQEISSTAVEVGLGLANVRRRLEGRYGEEATMQVSAEGDCFRVHLSLPAESGASLN